MSLSCFVVADHCMWIPCIVKSCWDVSQPWSENSCIKFALPGVSLNRLLLMLGLPLVLSWLTSREAHFPNFIANFSLKC